MPKQTRHRTSYNGIYFVELTDGDHSFFIRYKQNGKSFEERAGRSSQGWNAEKASFLRKERLSDVNQMSRHTWSGKGQLDLEKKWTFSVIFDAYLQLRPDLKGRENDIYRFRNYLKEDFGSITPSEVVTVDIERFRQKLQNQKLKPATVRHVLELLRRLANYALKKKFCSGLSFKIQMPTVENQKTENLTQEQLEKLLKVLDEEPDEAVSNIVRLVIYTGLRRGEIFDLKWNDIDFYGKTINIRSKKKGKKVVIPMNKMAENVLADHAQSEAKSKFVFPGRGGKKRTECKRPLLRIKKNAGLPDDFRLLQGLRHVYASMLASSGEVDMVTLQKLLTHKSPLMTRRYAHLREYALSNSYKELVQEQISTHDSFKEKPNAYDDESSNRDHEVSFDDDLSETSENKQFSEIAVQKRSDNNTFETLAKNENLEEEQKSVEVEIHEQKTEYADLDLHPIKMEVELDEIVSTEELLEVAEDVQNTEFDVHNGYVDYSNEKKNENEHLEEERIAAELEIHDQETEYIGVDPIKMEVDLNEIVSAEEFTEIFNDLHEYQTKLENKESDYIDELTAGIVEHEEKLEVEIDQEVYQAFSEENWDKDSVQGPTDNLVLKEDFFAETEAMEEISEISEENEDSLNALKNFAEGIPSEEKDLQTNEEKVILYNFRKNAESDTFEESGESIEVPDGELSANDDRIELDDFTTENNDSDNTYLRQQEFKAVESEGNMFFQETKIDYSNRHKDLVDFIAEKEKEKNTSNDNENINYKLRVEDYTFVEDIASKDDDLEKLINIIKDVSTNSEKNVHISQNTDGFNLSKDKLGKNNVSRSTTYQNSERPDSLKGVKIDLELNPENKESVINSVNSSRSSISELKKELMSFSDLVKSTPSKLKSSRRV